MNSPSLASIGLTLALEIVVNAAMFTVLFCLIVRSPDTQPIIDRIRAYRFGKKK